MTQREVVTLDRHTGEQLEFTLVAMPRERARIKERWFMIFQDGLQKLATDGTLTLRQLRVLLFLMGELDFENFIGVSQTKIADCTKIARPHVSAAMRELRDKGIIVAGPKVGRIQTLRLSDTFGWKGRVRSLQDARKKRLALVHNSDASARAELERRGQRRLTE